MTTEHAAKDIVEIEGTPFWYDASIQAKIDVLETRVIDLLSTDHSSDHWMRGISQDMNREFVRETSEIAADDTVASTRAHAEGKNLENMRRAMDLIEHLAESVDDPIRLVNIRQIHRSLFEGYPDDNPGEFRKGEATIAGAKFATADPMLIDWNMKALIDWLGPVSESQKLNAIATAAAAHTDLAQIHPFQDGNGRTARLLMNFVLRRAGYPIAIIARQHRERYYAALSEADQDGNITQLVSLLVELVSAGLKRYEVAADEQRQHAEVAQQFAELISRPEIPRLKDEYEIWKGAFQSLRSNFHSMVRDVNRSLVGGTVHIQSFDMVEFEKFADLHTRKPVRGTWFFRIDFRQGNTVARYSFTFRSSDEAITNHSPISLRLGREEAPNRFVWLDEISRTNVPRLYEIAYSVNADKFSFMDDKQRVQDSSPDDIVKRFFGEVIRCHFQH